jgi:hypothetical protein
MTLTILIFWIITMIALWRMISLVFALGNRIAVASEATAIIVSTFYANMTPEAQAKADRYLKGLKAK